MRFKQRLIGLLSCLAVAATLSACGGGEELTCGPGTQAQSGKCALTDDGCADGTVLAEDGTCVPEAGACDEGTTFDADLGKCIVNTDITCGEGTVAEEGVCVVAEPTSCGPNTERDANTGECVITDAACTTGTAYDAETDSCMPTDEVCAGGTTWSADDGMCMPDAQCQDDQVIVAGLCMTPAEELAHSAEVVEVENDDPTLGGTAQSVDLKAIGEELVFKGTIDEPSDIDGDDDATIDQDRDAYTFEADAGEWIEVGVQSTGAFNPGFVLTNAEGDYVRYSPFDTGAARQILIPATGTYTLTVAPAMVLQSGGAVGPLGGADWGYVGTIEKVDAPASLPQAAVLDAPVEGNFAKLDDNFYEVTGAPNDGLLKVDVTNSADHIDAELVVWGDDPEAHYRYPVPASGELLIKVPASNSVYMLVDYVQKRSHHDSFSIEATELTSASLGAIADNSSADMSAPVTVPDGDELYLTFWANQGQILEFTQDNTDQGQAKIELITPDQTVFNDGSVTAQSNGGGAFYHYARQTDLYIARVTSNFQDPMADLEVSVSSFDPVDLGTMNIGDVRDYTGGALSNIYRDWAVVEFPGETKVVFEGTHADGDMYVKLHDADGNITMVTNTTPKLVPAGVYAVEIYHYSASVSSYDLHFEAHHPPIREQEPNDTTANATPVPLGRDFSGEFAGGAVDIFSVDLSQDMAAGEVFYAMVTHKSGGAFWSMNPYDCRLLDGTGVEIMARTAIHKGCTFVTEGLTAGTYYIELTNPTSDTHTYQGHVDVVTATFASEPNETTTNAVSTAFADLTSGVEHYGEVIDGTDTDYFTFTINTAPAAGQVLALHGFVLGQNAGNVQWEVQDASGTVLASDSVRNMRPMTVDTANLSPGTYYIKLDWPQPSANAVGAYMFYGELATGGGSGGK